MLFEEELAIMDYNTSIHLAQEKGEEIGQDKLIKLYKWLHSNGRDKDFDKASNDPEYLKTLYKEYFDTHIS